MSTGSCHSDVRDLDPVVTTDAAAAGRLSTKIPWSGSAPKARVCVLFLRDMPPLQTVSILQTSVSL